MNIQLTPPDPRPGLAGEWDRFVGPGQNRNEFWLVLIPSLLAGAALPLYAILAELGWGDLQLAVGALLAMDLVGGVVTNATNSAKRWYHRPGMGWRDHLVFTGVHALHLFLVAWLFRELDWLYFGVFYAMLMGFAALIATRHIHLQRPVGLLLYSLALLANFYLLPPTQGMEWFIPLFFLKLLVSHIIKEAPFVDYDYP